MRYSYGIMDQGKILLYHPQLFLKEDDILILPSEEFQQWHGDLKELIDGLYQINSQSMNKTVEELNLVAGVLGSIVEELEQLFNTVKVSNSHYQYISTMDEDIKKRRENFYSNDMKRCDLRIPVKPEITPALKNLNMMELLEYANQKLSIHRKDFGKFQRKKKE
ncbi:MAG: hypothetical protein LLF83_05980 [Methanobacterium sp.]|nr:hypothetical protein [Methanobacterium sp.]